MFVQTPPRLPLHPRPPVFHSVTTDPPPPPNAAVLCLVNLFHSTLPVLLTLLPASSSSRGHPHGSPSPTGTPSTGRRGRQLPQLPAKSSSIEQGELQGKVVLISDAQSPPVVSDSQGKTQRNERITMTSTKNGLRWCIR